MTFRLQSRLKCFRIQLVDYDYQNWHSSLWRSKPKNNLVTLCWFTITVTLFFFQFHELWWFKCWHVVPVPHQNIAYSRLVYVVGLISCVLVLFQLTKEDETAQFSNSVRKGTKLVWDVKEKWRKNGWRIHPKVRFCSMCCFFFGRMIAQRPPKAKLVRIYYFELD